PTPPPPASPVLNLWVDSSGHLWAENSVYLWDLSHGSVFLMKSGLEPRDWRQAFPAAYQYGAILGLGGGNPGPDPYAALPAKRLSNARITRNSSSSAVVQFTDTLENGSNKFELITTMTLQGGSGLLRFDYQVSNVSASPAPPGLYYGWTLTPGGDQADDYFHYAGQVGQGAYPYGDQLSFPQPGQNQGYTYLTVYDVAARQGLAFIAALSQTAVFHSDQQYGRAQILDTNGNSSNQNLVLDATQPGTWYLLLYATDPITPYAPVDQLLEGSLP
ncbi:MAG: hypothetical protein HY335_02335, partial [Deinococcus sp.]|nr:hypothetical protein [Deinococcus sp.]